MWAAGPPAAGAGHSLETILVLERRIRDALALEEREAVERAVADPPHLARLGEDAAAVGGGRRVAVLAYPVEEFRHVAAVVPAGPVGRKWREVVFTPSAEP